MRPISICCRSIVLAIATSTSACGQRAEPPAQSSVAASVDSANTAVRKIRVGILPIVEVGPLYVGIEKGFFTDEGLEIELVRMAGGSDILPLVASGQLQVGFSNIVSLADQAAANPSAGLVILTGGTFETSQNRNHALVARKGLGTGKDALRRARRAAINTRRNIEELMLVKHFASQGIPDSQVELRTMGFPSMPAALDRAEVDIASLVEPFITKAVASGHVLVASQYLDQQTDTTMVAAYVTTRTWVSAEKALAERFQRAFSRSVAYLGAATNEAEVRAILGKFTGMPVDLVRKIGLPLMRDCISKDLLQRGLSATNVFLGKQLPTTDALLPVGVPLCGR